MTDARWIVFVEGESDEQLLRCLLRYLDTSNVGIERIGGGVSHIQHVVPRMKAFLDGGKQIAIILDADEDVAARRTEIDHVIGQFHLSVSRVFLLPNDEDPGDLETLLERMAVAEHDVVFACFDDYGDCLRAASVTRDAGTSECVLCSP